MIEPIVLILVLAAAPFIWVALDLRRQEQARRRAMPAAPTLVIEHVEPGKQPVLAA